MTKNVITATPGDLVIDAIKKLSENNISGMPVIDKDNKVVGMISETDILKSLKLESRTLSWVFPSSHALGMTFEESVNHRKMKDALKEIKNTNIEDIMKKEVITVDEKKTIAEVSSIMANNEVNRVPVIKDGKIIGIVTRGDIIQGIAKLV
jgi:CBS domain-containing protein